MPHDRHARSVFPFPGVPRQHRRRDLSCRLASPSAPLPAQREDYARPVRAYYESFWADAPRDPEPWAWERRRALLLGEARAGERVLDLGCGAGRFVAALQHAGADPVGVEVAEAALDRARENAPGADLRLVAEDGSLPLEHGSVDLVWCSEVLEHVADTSHLLLEARRVLRPGGRLLVTVPFHGRIKGALIGLLRFDAHFDPLGQHLRFYTAGSLQTTLEASGFGPVQAQPWGGPPLLRIGLMARALRP
jgi:SAM-dependent methyltransferase